MRGKSSAILTMTLLAAAISPRADAGIESPDSGVWSVPRFYQNSSEVPDYFNMLPGDFQLKTKLEEVDGVDSSTTLFGEIFGPNNFYASNSWTDITIPADKSTIRYWTQSLTEQGDYHLQFTTGDGQTISREARVVPEPSTLLLLGSSAAYLARRKRK